MKTGPVLDNEALAFMLMRVTGSEEELSRWRSGTERSFTGMLRRKWRPEFAVKRLLSLPKLRIRYLNGGF